MAKYRKKPVVIEAFQYSLYEPWPEWFYQAIKKGIISFPDSVESPIIRTLEGDHHVQVGDWVIQGVKGELYPCKPDIFEMIYESVD